jgi:hypothetical protein
VPPIVHEVLRSPGQPLDAATRAFFEPRFGADFSNVRVHDDARAADSANRVNAHAYAVGNHIVFAPDCFAPGAAAGRHLIAHELAHYPPAPAPIVTPSGYPRLLASARREPIEPAQWPPSPTIRGDAGFSLDARRGQIE